MEREQEYTYRSPKRSLLLAVLFLSVFVNLFFLVVPLFSMQVFDRVLSSESTDTLVLLALIAIFFLTVQGSFDWLRSQIMLRVAYYLEQRTESLALQKDLSGLSVKKRNRSAKSDLETVREVLASPAIFALFDAPFIPLFLLVLYLMHPSIGHFVLAGTVLLIGVSLLGFRSTHKLQKSGNEHIHSFQLLAHDWLRNTKLILSLGMIRYIGDKWRQESVNATVDRASIKQLAIHITSLSRYIRTLLQIGVLCISVILVLDNQVSAGVLIAASMIMGRVLAPIEQSIHHWQSWVSAWQAHKRLYELNSDYQANRDVLTLEAVRGKIEFDGVTIGQKFQAQPLLESLSFTIEAGKTTALIGPSGIGKTVLIESILGLVPVDSGEIRIDNASLNQYETDWLLQQIGYVPQNSPLLAGTIAQNICRFVPDASADEILATAKQAGIHNAILRLPSGYQTLVGSVGVKLSWGQQQQISLARALYGNPQLLILDEPLNCTDDYGHRVLCELLVSRRQSGQTTILITQRQSLLKYADVTLLISNRKVNQLGYETRIFKSSSDVEVA